MATHKCEGCFYWRNLNSAPKSRKICHHMYDTGKRKKLDGDICLSKAKEPAEGKGGQYHELRERANTCG